MATDISALPTWQGPTYNCMRQFWTSHRTPETNDRLQETGARTVCTYALYFLDGLRTYTSHYIYMRLNYNKMHLKILEYISKSKVFLDKKKNGNHWPTTTSVTCAPGKIYYPPWMHGRWVACSDRQSSVHLKFCRLGLFVIMVSISDCLPRGTGSITDPSSYS